MVVKCSKPIPVLAYYGITFITPILTKKSTKTEILETRHKGVKNIPGP